MTNQEARAELVGIPCGQGTPHEPHEWQMSATGYCRCPGAADQEARCVCGHVAHDDELGECYTSGCKCREFVLRADQDVRDEIAQVLRDATDNGADRTDDYAEAILEWMRERGYRKHPEPEWEFSIRDHGHVISGRYGADELDGMRSAVRGFSGAEVVRRTKAVPAGPWEPVPEEGTPDAPA